MSPEDLRTLLERLSAGQVSIEDAARSIQEAAVADLGFAHLDLHRRQRCGFPEVIFCEGKTPEWTEGLIRQLAAAGQDCLATRVSAEQSAYLARVFPEAEQ